MLPTELAVVREVVSVVMNGVALDAWVTGVKWGQWVHRPPVSTVGWAVLWKDGMGITRPDTCSRCLSRRLSSPGLPSTPLCVTPLGLTSHKGNANLTFSATLVTPAGLGFVG